MERTAILVLVAHVALLGQVTDPKPDAATPFFASESLEELRLRIAPSDWKTLKEKYFENINFAAELSWRDVALGRVAIRSRGNGSRSGVKPGLKISIDEYVKGQRFLGLDTMVLINLTQDPPMLRDYLCMQLFRKMGAVAPRETFVKLVVNGEPAGLYLAAEQVEKTFLARNFGENSGWLYDFEWQFPYHWEYLGPAEEVYAGMFQAQTNKTAPNHMVLAEMIRTLDQATPESLEKDLGLFLDIPQFVHHFAIEVYLAEQDGIAGDVGTNNFYLYQNGRDEKHRFIAWDKNATLAYYNGSIWRHVDENVLTRKVLAVPKYREQFLSTLARLTTEAGGEGGWLETLAITTWQRIREAAVADTFKPYSSAQTEQSVLDTLFFIRERPVEIARQLQPVE